MKKLKTEVMNKELAVRFNWAYIIVFVLFWSYGYQGAVSTRANWTHFDTLSQLGVCFYLIGAVIYFLFLGYHRKHFVTTRLTLQLKDIFLLGVMCFIWAFFLFDRLNQPIVGDHFFYGKFAKAHEIYAINFLNKFVNIGDIVFKDAMHFLDLFILISVALLIRLSKFIKFSFILVSILMCIALLLLRYLVISTGGGLSPQPPFQVFPLWLSTSIFSLSDFSLRMPQLMGLIGCSFLIYLVSFKKLGRINSFFIATALCSFPLFIHVATLVEGSIWTSVLWILLLIQIPLCHGKNDISYWYCIFSIISIFVLLRITSFIAYPIFFILFVFHHISLLNKNKSLLIYAATPILLCLPYLFISIINGTPATYISGESAFIPRDHLTFHRIAYAISSGVGVDTILSVINPLWIFLLLGIFILNKNEKFYLLNRFLIVLFLGLALAMFFSIRPVLWSTDRYKAEYLIPFIIFGGYLIFSKIYITLRGVFLIPILSSVIIYFNLVSFFGYPHNIADRVTDQRFKRASEQVYDYSSALIAAKNAGLAKNTLIVGVTYGVLPQILSGFTVEEAKKSLELFKKPIRGSDWTSVDPDLVNKEPDIKLVLLTDGGNVESIKRDLLDLGWSEWRQFHSINSKGVVYGLIRVN